MGSTPTDVSKSLKSWLYLGFSFKASASLRISESSYRRLGSLALSCWKFASLDFNAVSTNSGEPYLSSNLAHKVSQPCEGFPIVEALFLGLWAKPSDQQI